jgi:hypothetical protein
MPAHKHVTTCLKGGGPISKFCPCYHCTLAVCAVCGAYEGGLTSDCPGEKVSFDRQKEVYETNLDYIEGLGWHQSTIDRRFRQPRFEPLPEPPAQTVDSILECLAKASDEMQKAHDAAKAQGRIKLADAIHTAQWKLNESYRLLAEKASAMMFLIIGYTLFVLVSGVAIGATLVRDFLDGVWRKPRQPRPTIPLARVLHDTHWKQLDIATVKRRQQIPTLRS